MTDSRLVRLEKVVREARPDHVIAQPGLSERAGLRVARVQQQEHPRVGSGTDGVAQRKLLGVRIRRQLVVAAGDAGEQQPSTQWLRLERPGRLQMFTKRGQRRGDTQSRAEHGEAS